MIPLNLILVIESTNAKIEIIEQSELYAGRIEPWNFLFQIKPVKGICIKIEGWVNHLSIRHDSLLHSAVPIEEMILVDSVLRDNQLVVERDNPVLVKSIAHIIGFQMTLTQSLAPAGSMETC